ncbi:MAG: RES family NAD+ phosphorylase [Pseudomonadales bacterium]|nr:RES family NAD+ phosphorylase [Pseudomonadales bacterium]
MSFKSWRSYWKFTNRILNESRYIYDDEEKHFIDTVLKTCERRVKDIKKERVFWRAQMGCDTHIDEEFGERKYPYSSERMFPKKEFAKEGRVNPKGIPYIYLATDHKTSINECRPWVGMELSVGIFITKRELKVIDCSEKHSSNPLFFDVDKGIYEPDDAKKEEAVWAHIDRAFSRPINPTDTQADYVPTQILAEAFKQNGYDGVVYKSMLGPGYNLALFDLSSVKLHKRHLFEVKSIDLEVVQVG